MQQELNNESLFSHIQGYILEFGCPCSFSYCSFKDIWGNLSQRLSGHILFIIVYVIVDRSNLINCSTLSQFYEQSSDKGPHLFLTNPVCYKVIL